VIAPHATPAAAHAALAEFLTESAPELMSVRIDRQHGEVDGQTVKTYTAEIHVHLPHLAAWMELHGFTAADARWDPWGKKNSADRVVSVTSHTGVKIFALDLHDNGGAE